MNLLLDSVAEGGRVVWTASGTHDPETTDGKWVGAAAEPDARALAFEEKNGQPLSGGGAAVQHLQAVHDAVRL